MEYLNTTVELYQDNNWSSPFVGFSIFKTRVDRPSRIISAPVENGQAASDNKVIDPIKIELNGKMERQRNLWHKTAIFRMSDMKSSKDKSILLSVVTPEGFYNNLIIKEVVTDAEPGEIDLINCTVYLEEVLIIQGTKNSPRSSDNQILSRTGYVNI